MARGDVAKGHCRTYGSARARIGPSHNASGIVPDRVQACDRLAGAINHLRTGICANASVGAQFAWDDAHGVKRRLIERGNAWIGLVTGRAVEALVGI